MMKLKNILVPIDFSKEAALAVEWAVKLAKEEKKSTVFLLHVITPIPIVPEAGIDVQSVLKSEMEQAERQVKTWKKKIPHPFQVVTDVVVGDMADEVRDYCGKNKINLVVMTTHGRRGLSRMIHPNTSEKVVRLAPCPVLVLHRNQT